MPSPSPQQDRSPTPDASNPLDNASFSPGLSGGYRAGFAATIGAALLGAAGALGCLSASEEAPAKEPPAPATDKRPAPALNPLAQSLPRSDGKASVPGLSAPVTVTRDELGLPIVKGKSFEDVLRAEGFLHAQERFFQMDLTRRQSSGRLAELVGAAAVPSDERSRLFRFEEVAQKILDRMPESEKKLLQAYADGVNAGLKDLEAAPPEYLILKNAPAPWSSKDSILVVLSMFDQMHFNERFERSRGVMKEALPKELYEFLNPARTRFDSPLTSGDPAFRPAAVPGPEVVDLRARERSSLPPAAIHAPAAAPGSNNWAVAGSRSSHGGAIVANDPHLGLGAPGVWYRCQMEWGEKRLSGISLPGSPGIVIGSNGKVSWGFTNSLGDFQDMIIVEVDPKDPSRYRTPEGFEAFKISKEQIRVHGGEAKEIAIKSTRWGVVSGEDWKGRPIVMKWTAQEPEMVNLAILHMADAKSVDDGVAVMRKWFGPSQNVLLADEKGRIAWVVSGCFPKREGFDGRTPVSWATPGIGWNGPQDERDRPVIVDPKSGILFTANNRTIGVEQMLKIGMTPDLGARAKRIGELLGAKDKLSEKDLLAIQLDTRVEVYDYYRELLLKLTENSVPGTPQAEARAIVKEWNGRADSDQAGMRILNAFREDVHRGVLAPLLAPCAKLDKSFDFYSLEAEEPVRRILEERPAHLLPPGSRDWDGFLSERLADTLDNLKKSAPEKGLKTSWGEVNKIAIAHPLFHAAPPEIRALLGMPPSPISGHRLAVKVLEPSYGASMRMDVSPGREQDGIMHMPAGQAGHPLNPNFRDGHSFWVEGRPQRFAPGDPKTSFVLEPPGKQ